MTKKTILLLLLTGMSVGMLAGRVVFTQSWAGIWLVWNLFLAWIPLMLIRLTEDMWQHKLIKNGGLLVGLTAWLLFFPNAPYLITDLIHLKESPDYMLWFDSLLGFSFALAGLLTGLYSLLKVHRLTTRAWNKILSWVFVAGSVFISSFGLYLGRFGRWNSWDILTSPLSLLKYSFQSLNDPLAIQTTLAFSFAIGLIYWAFWLFAASLDKHHTR